MNFVHECHPYICEDSTMNVLINLGDKQLYFFFFLVWQNSDCLVLQESCEPILLVIFKTLQVSAIMIPGFCCSCLKILLFIVLIKRLLGVRKLLLNLQRSCKSRTSYSLFFILVPW